MRKLLPAGWLIGCAILATPLPAQSAAAPQPIQIQPAKPADSVLPVNLTPGGPAIPNHPPVESAHPAPILLWPQGAPGSEAHQTEPETVAWRQEKDLVFPIIYNIHNPSITPYLPAKDKATGCAVIIAPGGGHMQLTIDREGYDFGQWLADHGVAAFVLKYRLQNDNANPRGSGRPQPYRGVPQFAAQDALRAVRLIRSRATEWGIDPQRVGLVGFSAGGEVAIDSGLLDAQGNATAADPIDRLDGRPNFLGIIYPGQPAETRAPDWAPPATFPPSFLLSAANDSQAVAGPNGLPKLYNALHEAKIPVELHIFEEGEHGFGVRQWDYSVSTWPNLFRAWLNDRGYLKKAN
ncbi:MAG TPA: alpha/beta hydrolase [Opitutales bacterium]|nr:alpha/beta hydrolase [Opitutales bacterium]